MRNVVHLHPEWLSTKAELNALLWRFDSPIIQEKLPEIQQLVSEIRRRTSEMDLAWLQVFVSEFREIVAILVDENGGTRFEKAVRDILASKDDTYKEPKKLAA
jgi:hypothetical protein